MPQYKLMYFNFKALAEPIRFLFNYGGIEFEDYRYTFDEWTNELKPKAPFGQGPLLEVDGKTVYWQSVAIQRFVAELVGLAGKTNLEKLEVDMMVDSIWDVRCLLYIWKFGAPEKKDADEENVLNVQLPFRMNCLEKFVSANGGFFVKGGLSWPDLAYTAYYPYLCAFAGKDIEGGVCPNLKALRKKVEEIPAIKSYIERRPVTEF